MLLAIVLPFDRVPSIDVGGFTIRLSTLIGSLLVLLWLRRVILSHRLLLTPIEYVLVGFVLLNSVMFVMAADQKAAAMVVVPTLFVIAVALAVRHILTPRSFELTIVGLFVGAVGVALFGIYQFIGDFAGLPHWMTAMRPEYEAAKFGFPRVLSTMLEPLFLSAYLLLPIGLLTSRITAHRTSRWLVTALMILVVIDVLTLSRGGLIALVVLFISVVLLSLRRNNHVRMRRVAGRFLIGAVVSIVVALSLVAVLNRQGNDSDVTYGSRGAGTFVRHLLNTKLAADRENLSNNDSVAERDLARTLATHNIFNSPQHILMGYGPGQYASQARPSTHPTVANVLLLDIWLHYGAIGVMLIVWLICWMMYRLWLVRQSWVAVGLMAYYVAISLQSMTFSTLYIMHLWFAVGLSLYIIETLPKTLKNRYHKNA